MIKTIGQAFERLRGLIGTEPDPALCIGFVHTGPPVSKCRYTKAAMDSIIERFKLAIAGNSFHGNVALLAICFRPNRQRIDADNLLKMVVDAGTKALAWEDDCQVTIQGAIIELDLERPRTIVALCECPSSLTRGDDAKVRCVVCGNLFFPYGVQRRLVATWCSRECSKLLPRKCPECDLDFKPHNYRSKFCSIRCRGIAQAKRDKAARAAKTHCVKGHLLDDVNTHILPNGGKRCRKCQSTAARLHRLSKTT